MMKIINVTFYLAVMFYLGRCAIVNMEALMTEDKPGDVTAQLDEIIEEFQLEPNLSNSPNINETDLMSAMVSCHWSKLDGYCNFSFPSFRRSLRLKLHARYPDLFFSIKYGSICIASGDLHSGKSRKVKFQRPFIVVKMKLFLRFFRKQGLKLCFGLRFQDHSYSYKIYSCTVHDIWKSTYEQLK